LLDVGETFFCEDNNFT